MPESFIDQLAKIHTIDPEKIFDGLYSLFSQIRNMKANELICAMQAINLGLELTETTLSKKQETVLMSIFISMQRRAYETRLGAGITSDALDELFFVNINGWRKVSYDASRKRIMERTPETRPVKPIANKWFRFDFFKRSAMHDPLDV